MTGGERTRITFGRPDVDGLRQDGFQAVDMHVHSRSSDAAPSARQILKVAQQRRIGIAITDHNEIGGVREIRDSRSETLVVPGIELDCAEGPHFLLYFYSYDDLADFYDRHIRPRRRGAQYMTSYPSAEEILSFADGYSCLRIAAHPFGYFGLDRGVLKCEAKNLLPGIADRLDGIEAICGGMTRRVNGMAAEYAERFHTPVTGGSDGHILQEVGSVVTGVPADSVADLLDGIKQCRSIVVGSPSGIVSRGVTAGVIACNYVPFTATALHTRIGPHTTRIRHSVYRFFRPR